MTPPEHVRLQRLPHFSGASQLASLLVKRECQDESEPALTITYLISSSY